MGEQRRIVVDTSAIVPAFFPDGVGRIDRGAAALLNAVRHRHVVAFAPEMLRFEFMSRVIRRIQELRDEGVERDTAVLEMEAQWLSFTNLGKRSLVYTPSEALSAIAWDAACRYNTPPPDSWFLACARLHDAELWMSHPAEDGAGEAAKRYGVVVRYLSHEMFGAA